uniref:Cytochrome P450 71A1 n=1 Tax=Setaria italica TaxID=4555 RepID=K3YCN6_SETIT
MDGAKPPPYRHPRQQLDMDLGARMADVETSCRCHWRAYRLPLCRQEPSARHVAAVAPSLPLLGHLHLIGRLAHRSLHELQLRYGGGGILYLQLGRRRTLVVSTAAAATDQFRNHDLAFASRPRSMSAEKLIWRRGKKVAVVHLLSPRRVESFAPVRAAEAGEAVELRRLLYGYTNAVVTRAATGAAGATAERLKQLLGIVRWATGLDKKLDDIAEAWDKFLSKIVASHEEKRANGVGDEDEEDFLDVLLRLRREGADGLELTDDRIKATVKDMIVGATETSSQTLEWAMAEVVANPRVMTKLQDEIARVVATADQPTIAEAVLNKMEYLKAVFKEVLRLHAPAPLLVPHESTIPAVVQGYEIPAKTSLFVNVWAIGRDPAAWDAQFRPERFVGGSGGGPPVDFRGTDYQLIPFGAGRRICPGINFALPILEIALAGLLRHFDWELPAGMSPADLDMVEEPGLTTPRRVPLVLVPECRTLAQGQPALQ